MVTIASGSRVGAWRSAGKEAACFGKHLACGVLLLAGTLGATACAQPAGRPDEQTLAAIHALIGSAGCQDQGQCRAIGIGANPCGGPEQYLAWSTFATDADALQRLAARYAEQRRKLHERTGMSSVCVLLPEPNVRCERQGGDAHGRCVLAPVTPGSSPIR